MLLTAQRSDAIAYNANGPFNWDMFKGRVTSNHQDRNGRSTGAVTVSSLSYQTFNITSKSAGIKIVALFHPKESWTRYPKIENPAEALNHEKRHFDICEIYARLIRQEVSLNHFYHSNFNQKLDAIFKRYADEFQMEQEKYDRETDHSINTKGQKKWNDLIDARLKELSPYSQQEVSITFK
jgi:hypothetical protein